jgi:predicted DNA-binding protein (MmcQ/YjbR family)
MNIDEFREYCLAKPETTEEFPFDNNTLAFKVMGKMFALTSLASWEKGDHSINLKCDPQKAEVLREQYPDDVFPGYHMNKKHWNTVNIDQTALSEKYIRYLINHSYELVVSKLPKSKKDFINDQLAKQ